MASVSVVIPTFNERESIESQIRKILDVTPNLLEVVVVDDDSPDGTWMLVEDYAKKDKRVRLIRRKGERGLASAIFDGVESSAGETVIWLDCDHDPDEKLVKEMVSSLEEGADVCIASRYVSGGRELRGFCQKSASRLINFFARTILSSSIHDYTTGFVAVKKSVFSGVGWLRKGYGEYCIEFLYKALRKGYVVREAAFVCTARTDGHSKTSSSLASLAGLGLDYGIKILRLRFNLD